MNNFYRIKKILGYMYKINAKPHHASCKLLKAIFKSYNIKYS